jgi:type II secretory ATPase GspE/PulE/Tfp pilus assembly ATPase PilB-like protein
VIFGFGKKKDDDFEEEDEIELISFQGPHNGETIDLKANAKLLDAGLLPAKEIVTDAILRRADMVRIDPKGDRSAIYLIVDGVAYPGDRLSKQEGLAVTMTMKLLAGLNIKNRTQPQSGGLNSSLEGKKYEVVVESQPLETGGERLNIKLRDLAVKLDSPAAIGIPDSIKDRLRELAGEKKGLFISAGPPRSGLTTTSLALMKVVDVYILSVYSITDMSNRDITNVTKFDVNPNDSLETTLQRIIRVDADFVFAPPLRSVETAKTLLEYQSQLALLTEMPAPDAASAILQLVKLVGDPAMVANGLKAVVSPKMIRLLCDECKEAFRPNPKIIAKAGLPAETKVLYRAPVAEEGEELEPCPKCGGIGYYGRSGIFEMIEINDDIKKLITSGAANVAQIKSAAKNAGMPTFKDGGLAKVAEGKTSLEELQRLFKS